MASLGWGVGGQLLDDAHLDVPLETLLDLLFPVQGDPVGDGVTCWSRARLDCQLEFWPSHAW